MFGLDETLLIRALNATRQGYFPTYIGLRLVADQLPPGANSYLRRAVERRLVAGDAWKFRPFEYFKAMRNVAGVDIPEYRQCLAPSPFTAVAEASILARLAAMPSFAPSQRAFSYLWPKSTRTGLSYAFFAEGYKRRNQEIALALQAPSSVAVVVDIRGFYPSADRLQLLEELSLRLKQADSSGGLDSTSIVSFYEQLLAAGQSGIPVGPASGHVLGHLAMTKVDAELTAEFGASYFRYVDDIVVVCDGAKADETMRRIDQCVTGCGYSLNVEKSIIMPAAAWNSNLIRQDIDAADDFRKFAHDLSAYLALHPDRKDDLQVRLAEAGLSIPLSRIAALSKYSRFRFFLALGRAPGGLKGALHLYLQANSDFVERGRQLKRHYENALDTLLGMQVEGAGELRRFHVQRIRRVVNTLFYLRRFSEWEQNGSLFESVPELVEQKALASALASGVANSVLPFYPRGPAAFAELWSEHGEAPAMVQLHAGDLTGPSSDSLCTLALTNAVAPSSIREQTGDESVRLLRTILAPQIQKRESPDLSFEDEFESLRLGSSQDEIATLAKTRYARAEGATFDVLTLLSSEYRS